MWDLRAGEPLKLVCGMRLVEEMCMISLDVEFCAIQLLDVWSLVHCSCLDVWNGV